MSALETLESLIPKPKSIFHLPYITTSEVNQIVKFAKGSNSTGFDDVSINILKKVIHIIGPHIMHLNNTIIRTSIEPENFKLTKVIPLSEPNKPTNLLSSYRPINILSSVEKVFE